MLPLHMLEASRQRTMRQDPHLVAARKRRPRCFLAAAFKQLESAGGTRWRVSQVQIVSSSEG